MLTKDQLTRIVEAIRKRFLSLSLEATGEQTLTESELAVLKRAGLIRESVRHLTTDGYTLGKIVALLDETPVGKLSYDDVLRISKKMAPLTPVERRAMEYASEHAGQYIRGIGDDLVKESGAAAARSGMSALRAVQQAVGTAIEERQTTSELKSELFRLIDNKHRDWQRVAFTELQNAIQQGVYAEIAEKSDDGHDQVVYKRPSPDACKHCKRLYLEDDGITPRVFRLRDLAETNVGLKSGEWVPTIGSTHPWCLCQLVAIPEGYDFEKQRVVTEPFDRDGKEYKSGQVLSDEEHRSLPREQKAKTGFDAILSHTGTTAQPSVKKSLTVSDNDGCICQY